MNDETKAQRLYLQWVKANHPDVYARALPGVSGLGFVAAIAALASQVVGFVQKHKAEKEAARAAKKQERLDKAAAIRQSKADALLALNTSRVQAGQVPVNFQGQPLSSTSAILKDAGGSYLPLVMIGAGTLALVMLRRK